MIFLGASVLAGAGCAEHQHASDPETAQSDSDDRPDIPRRYQCHRAIASITIDGRIDAAEYAHRPAPPKSGDIWRINFSRVEWKHEVRNGEYVKIPDTAEVNWVWTPQGVINMHLPEHWGYLEFVEEN